MVRRHDRGEQGGTSPGHREKRHLRLDIPIRICACSHKAAGEVSYVQVCLSKRRQPVAMSEPGERAESKSLPGDKMAKVWVDQHPSHSVPRGFSLTAILIFARTRICCVTTLVQTPMIPKPPRFFSFPHFLLLASKKNMPHRPSTHSNCEFIPSI